MFETEMSYESGNGHWRSEAGWPGETGGLYGEGEEEYPGATVKEKRRYPAYGQGEEEYPYGEGEEEYPGAYGQGEEEYPATARAKRSTPTARARRRPGAYGQGEEEYPGAYGQGEEERFLPLLTSLIPMAGQLLGGLLGNVKREISGEAGYGEAESSYEQGEAGQAEEEFLLRILSNVLGKEAEADEVALSPAQEAELASQLMEASNEEELGRILGKVINTVGRAVQGVSGAVNSPQGRALIDAVAPIAQAALTGESEAPLVSGNGRARPRARPLRGGASRRPADIGRGARRGDGTAGRAAAARGRAVGVPRRPVLRATAVQPGPARDVASGAALLGPALRRIPRLPVRLSVRTAPLRLRLRPPPLVARPALRVSGLRRRAGCPGTGAGSGSGAGTSAAATAGLSLGHGADRSAGPWARACAGTASPTSAART